MTHPPNNKEWLVSYNMNIKETRILYNVISSINPADPNYSLEERGYLKYLKGKLFAMICDYNFTEEN